MIKGVSRYAVEVAVNDSPFFEKVICFVRPQYAGGSALDLHREALRMADHLGAGVEEAQNGSRGKTAFAGGRGSCFRTFDSAWSLLLFFYSKKDSE